MKLAQKFKNLISEKETLHIMGCHDALSAKIAEQAGFQSLWASGLGISLVHGKNDSNELSWSQVAYAVENMADFVQIPVIVDADTGYGDFNNARIFAERLVRSHVAGMALEDKRFPKTNSFVFGNQDLEDVHVFSDKLKAVKDKVGEDLFLIGRLEGFISGQPLEDTISRAFSYVESGADALIVHSKKKTSEDVAAFLKVWDKRVPVIIIPTTYPDDLPHEHFEGGVNAVIWANQSLRAQITALRDICNNVFQNGNISNIAYPIASVSEVLAIAGSDQLEADRVKYSGIPPEEPAL